MKNHDSTSHFNLKNTLIYESLFVDFLLLTTFLIGLSCQAIAQQIQQDSISETISATSGIERVQLLLLYSRQLLADDPLKSLKLARDAEKIAQSKKSQSLLSEALKIEGDALFGLDSLKPAAYAYSLAAETEELLANPRQDTLMIRYSDAGYAFQEMGLFEKALSYFEQGLKISKALNDSTEIASNLSNIGVSLKMLGRYGEAIELFQQTLAIDATLGNESDMAMDYNNIGMVCQAWHQYDRAIEFFTKAFQIDERLGNQNKLSTRLSNIGQVYLAWGKPDEAIENFNKALVIDREMNATGKIAIRLQGLGLAYMSLHDYQRGIAHFNEALHTFQSLNIEYQSAIVLDHIGDAYNAMKDVKNAEYYYRQSLDLSKKIGLKPTIIAAAKGLYELYKNQKDFKKSLQYFEIFKIAEDSVFSEASARQINEFEIRYETEKKENQNQLLIKDLQIKERNQWFMLTLITALIVLSVSLFYAFRVKKKSLQQSRILYEKESELSNLKVHQIEKQNLHLQELFFAEEEIKELQARSIEQKNHELTSATMLIANKNEVFDKLKKLATHLGNNHPAESKETVKEIIREIEKQTDIESQWDQFRLHFESVHKSFFVKLRQISPGLTQADLQLCAYIKLNISTKEISKLMNIAPESVNTHRYRLRKKIELDDQETLDGFIHGL